MRGFGAYAVAVALALFILCSANLAVASQTTSPVSNNAAAIGIAPVGNDLGLIDIGGFLRLLGGFLRVGISASGTTGGSSGGGSTANFTWQQIPVGAGGFITGMSIANDDTMVIRTDTYGAYLWNGAEWEQLVNANSMPSTFLAHSQAYGDYDGVFAIQVAPSNSSDMYMVYPVYDAATSSTVSGVYASTNKGTTWTQTNFSPIENGASLSANGPYRMWGQKMAINPTAPNDVYVGTGAQGLFVTTDGGNSWSVVSGVPAATSDGNGQYPGITGILFDPGNTNVIYAASYGNGIYQTTNGGTNWSQINGSGGPSTVTFAAISSNGTDGTYFVIDSSSNLWVYANGTWTEALSSGDVGGVAVDPSNASHIIASDSNDQLIESNTAGSTWDGWSATATIVSNDIPWLTDLGIYGASPLGLHFDQVIPDKLYVNSSRSVWTMTLSGSVTSGSALTWTDQGVGIEQLVANEIIVPPVASSAPLLASWDTAVFTPNLITYPSSFDPVADSNVAAGWSIDYASSNPNYVCVLADGTYAGGPQRSGCSSNDGQTWTLFPNLPYNTFGGDIAVSTPTNLIFAGAGGVQPYYTTNATSSTITWNPITLPGVSSWSNFVAAYFYSGSRVVTADRVLPNTFYLLFYGVGIFKTTDGGADWTLVNNGSSIPIGYPTAQLKSTPGEAGDLWLASDGTLLHSMDGGSTWTTISNVGESSNTVGFGAPAPGQSYPSVYTVGWIDATSSTSITIGTGSKTLTVQTGLAYQAGNAITITQTSNGNNSMDGTVTSYNSSTGSLVVNVTLTGGSGTISNWTVAGYGGVLESDNEGVTWRELGPWPFGSLDHINDISGDPNIYGQVYVGFNGSGYAFYSADGPRLRSLYISPSSGSEDTGATVTLTLGLSEPVTVADGTPTLTLNDGETATYSSGSGTGALTFSYTVQSGDTTSSLAATAINLNGATIADSGGNVATLSLSGLDQTGPRIAAVPATIDAVAESPSSGILEPGATSTLTLDMSNPVTVAGGTPTLSLNSGGTATYTGGSGTTALVFGYTVGSGDNASSLAATTVNLNGATISNTDGNANLSLSGLTQTGPEIVGTTTGLSLTYKSKATIQSGGPTVDYGTLTWGSGCTRLVVAIAAYAANDNTTVSSVTVGGISATQVSGAAATDGYATSDIWEAAATSTSGDVQITYSGDIISYAPASTAALYCLVTTAPTGSGANVTLNDGAGSSISQSIYVPTGGAAIAVVETGSGAETYTWTNATADASSTNAAFAHTTTTGTVNVTATMASPPSTLGLSLASWAP